MTHARLTDNDGNRSLFAIGTTHGASAVTANSPSTSRPTTLTRSATPQPSASSKFRSPLPLPYRLVKSTSTSHIYDRAKTQARMAVAVTPPVPTDPEVMDTRTPSPAPRSTSSEARSSADGEPPTDEAYTPDLSKEVSMLSTKLINAINYQTNLDDALQAARHELDQAQRDLKRVQAEKQSLHDAITEGVLVKKSEMDKTIAAIRADLAIEREKREGAERSKRQTDNELESLTSSLFEEANKMVAEARRDTETMERRNSQLRGQLSDTEALMASQQEQLQDMKLVMERLDSSLPSTPINSHASAFDHSHTSPNGEVAHIPPDHPLHFTQLLSPVLRTDVYAYTDFAELLTIARRNAPHSRNASGNMVSSSSTNLHTLSAAAASSSPSLPGAFSFSANNSPSSSTFAAANPVIPTLKETRFYKRSLVEDIEPTLRLDLAPGLSFLSRRSVQSALLNGTLVVEPFAQTSNWKLYSPVFACALCGESRKNDPYTRKYRFRTSESDDAQRYPLCDYCLGRIRASGDYVSFLRMVRDGHWRCGSEAEEQHAWEESVRLRERMFWARLGGGVVPTAALRGLPNASKEARDSLGDIPEGSTAASAGVAKPTPPALPTRRDPDPKTPDPAETHTDSDAEAEAIEASAKELRRRTMLHMSEDMSVLQRTRTLSDARPSAEIPAPIQIQHEEQPEVIRESSGSEQAEDDSEHNSGYATPQEVDETPLPPSPTPAPAHPTPQSRPLPALPSDSEESVADERESTWKDAPIAVKAEPTQARPSSATSSASNSRTNSTSATSPSLAPVRPENERRPSSVLARVRAMEQRG